ncbi:MAG: hypothetical protein P8L68_04260 [Paracoccaceae bacterium]|nr:hypothetical protein [Paracoccaceae bacterium]MDG1737632.1 hypothetical protein [Paracoccaceae bacterium]MDG2257689.1 hypothetical protein [Paracoccaceae bacterium]
MAEQENLTVYRELVERFFQDRVKGKANPYTSMNGNMFSFLDKAGVVCLRMSKEDRISYAEEFRTGEVIQYGSVMRGYVAIPEDRLTDPDGLEGVFKDCLKNARALPKK